MRARTQFWLRVVATEVLASQPASMTWAESGKILLGPHIGYATIIDIAGVDSDKAVLRLQRKLDDVIEECSRVFPTNDDNTLQYSKIAKCAMDGLKAEGNRVATRRAFCSRGTLYTEFGNFSLTRHIIEVHEYEAMKSRRVRTEWKDHKTDRIIDTCGGCGPLQLIDTFRVLCPTWYRNAFGDYDPY